MSKYSAAKAVAAAIWMAVFALLAISGCGEDVDAGGEPAPQSSAGPTEGSPPEAPIDEPPADPPADPSEETSPESTPPGGTSAPTEASTAHDFCDVLTAEEYRLVFNAMSRPALARRAVTLLDGIVLDAPSALRADLRTITDAFRVKAAGQDGDSGLPHRVDADRFYASVRAVTRWEDASC